MSRYNFYKKHGIYLIWILDNFNIHAQRTLEKDIKYLAKYQNFFKLDETVTETLQLRCEYKLPFLTEKNEARTKWNTMSVPLSKITFDDKSYQIYYFNYPKGEAEIETQKKRNADELEAKRIRDFAEKKATNIKNSIKELRRTKSRDFVSVSSQITMLDKYEAQVLNEQLGFRKNTPIFRWLSNADYLDTAFFEFIFSCEKIDIDVNLSDEDGKTAFQVVYENKDISHIALLKLLFKRGYKITDTDRSFFSTLPPGQKNENDMILYGLCSKLTNKSFVDSVFQYDKQLMTIESAKHNKIIGFNYSPNAWIAFANNAIDHYQKQWEFIELAFRKYGLWDSLIHLDKKGTFTKKLQSFYLNKPSPDYEFSKVFIDLYPEIGPLQEG